MTFEELQGVARRRGLVRWTRSGLVEKVRLPRRKQRQQPRVIAQSLITKKDNVILNHEGDFYCVEVKRDELLTAKDLGYRRR